MLHFVGLAEQVQRDMLKGKKRFKAKIKDRRLDNNDQRHFEGT